MADIIKSVLGELGLEIVLWLAGLLVAAVWVPIIYMLRREWNFIQNSKRIIFLISFNPNSDILGVKTLLQGSSLFSKRLHIDVLTEKDYRSVLNQKLKNKATYVIDYNKDVDSSCYMEIASDASAAQDNIPILIYTSDPQNNRVSNEHERILKAQPYCDTVNTPIRLLTQMIAIYKVMPRKKA